ncbi:E3 ubiquitin-protein ligase SDIR1-like [Dioscorea cayenensis subsp. rotundata]|uniref:RING-type E3 ubiquitin transferase n=1 Tax=Dioscorea cayennensis subsp. rotundata TaxID=55577 RepID=A0AB40C997_DIOCR|nr:E3 ubiquitin-protein ligase SDIR1-like [Dioscorea cayenensis subsp. rotundata]
MSFVFRGSRGEIESGIPEFIPGRRTVRWHPGARPVNSNSLTFLVAVLLLFMILNSNQMSPNFLLWLALGVFLMATSLRMYATCQQLQAQAQAHAAAASGLLGHTELRLHMPPSIAFATRGRLQGLRLQLALLDREFDDLDYDTLRALDSDNNPDAPSMSEEEINALPVHIYKSQSNQGSASGPKFNGSSLQQASSSSGVVTEKKQDNVKSEENTKALGDELTCSVCLEQVNVGELVRSLPCFHQFHCNCIDPWLRQQGTCPIYKYRVSSGWQETGEGELDASYMV